MSKVLNEVIVGFVSGMNPKMVLIFITSGNSFENMPEKFFTKKKTRLVIDEDEAWSLSDSAIAKGCNKPASKVE